MKYERTEAIRYMDQLHKAQIWVNICDLTSDRPLPGMEYEEFLQTGDTAPVEKQIDNERDVMTVNYTSGTTGMRKGVMSCAKKFCITVGLSTY